MQPVIKHFPSPGHSSSIWQQMGSGAHECIKWLGNRVVNLGEASWNVIKTIGKFAYDFFITIGTYLKDFSISAGNWMKDNYQVSIGFGIGVVLAAIIGSVFYFLCRGTSSQQA